MKKIEKLEVMFPAQKRHDQPFLETENMLWVKVSNLEDKLNELIDYLTHKTMKKREKGKSIPIAILYWHDAAMIGSQQLSTEEASEQTLIKGWVVGIIVKETDEFITLAMDWFESGDYRQIHVYPKSGIEILIKKELKGNAKQIQEFIDDDNLNLNT